MDELKKIAIIAHYTFTEIYKSKIIFNVLLLGFAICGVSLVASEFTYGVPDKVALDFGLGVLTLSSVAIAILMGANLISKEIENRTVYMILSRPIRRASFLIGRLIGMWGILSVNLAILSIMSLSAFTMLGGEIDWLIMMCLAFTLLEAIIILGVVILFSLISNQVLAVIFTISVYIAGHAIENVLNSQLLISQPIIKVIAKAYTFIFPNLAKLNYKDHVLYQQDVPWMSISTSVIYAVVYALFLLIVSSFIFERKNLD